MSTALAALLVGATLPSGAAAAVLNFEGLGGFNSMPLGYGGLNWGTMWSLDESNIAIGAAVSGTGYAVNGPFVSTEHITGPAFDFEGVYLTSYIGGMLLSVSGSANGVTLYSQLVSIDTSPTWFDFDYADIDTLTFSVISASDPTGIFAIDDFTFNEVVGSIADWTDSTLDLLIGPGGPLGSNVALQENESLAEHNLTITSAGSFTQNGGVHTVNGSMQSRGSYTLNGGSLSVAGDETIDSGYGYGSSTGFTQFGGSHTVAGTLTLGSQPGFNGVYSLLGGTLSALNEVIGDGGEGMFNQYGGTNTVGETLTLAKQAGSYGSYYLLDGTLSTKNTVIGDGGWGYFTQRGGTHTVAQTLTLGKQAGSSGSYNFEKGELNTGDVIIGDGGTGYFSQGFGYPYVDYPTHNVKGTLTLGKQVGSYGNYSLTTGLVAAKHIVVGDAGSGSFTQYGGMVQSETMTLGKQASGNGNYYQYFGELNTGDLVVGDAGRGSFTHGDTALGNTYGYSVSNKVTGTLTLGKQAGSVGTYDLVRGLLTAKNVVVGDAGRGIFTQRGGEHNVAETLILGRQAGANGDYNLQAGALTATDQIIGDAGNGTFTQGQGTYGYSASNTVNGTLTLGRQAGSQGNYYLMAGTLSAVNEIVGDAGAGAFSQSGGTHSVAQTLTLGKQAGGWGHYSLSAGALSASDEVIGDAGTGVFDQWGGTHTVAGTLTLGKQVGGEGVYYLTNGQLTAGNLVVGDAGRGEFSQGPDYYGYSSSNTVNGTLTLGKQAGSNGIYNLIAGALSAVNEVVGDGGVGVFEQRGGTNEVAQTLVLGKQAGSEGTYKLSAGALLATDEVIGDAGIGTFTQGEGSYGYSSSNTVKGTLTLGKQAGSQGIYNLLAGTVSALNTVVGDAGTGTFNQLGGTHTASELTLGKQAGGVGAYNLTSGELRTERTVVGDAGYGVFTQSGGLHWATTLVLGQQADSYGQYTQLGGSLQSFHEVIGDAGTGVFTQLGGTNQVLNLTLGRQAGSSGTYNLRGGELSVMGDIVDGAGHGSLLISGGTLRFDQTLFGNQHDVDVDTLKLSGQGSIKLGEDVTVTFQKAVEHNGKTIDVAAGANAIFNGAFSGKGPFTGAGTATFNSVLNVGDAPITFSVAGNMVLGEHSKSIMQIGGTARGTGYDAVNVGNALSIDGELNVVGLNGFNGDLGDVFDLFTAETINGEFDLLTLLLLDEGLSWKIEYLVDAIGTKDVVRLSVVSSVPLPASVWLLQSALFGLFAARRFGRKNR